MMNEGYIKRISIIFMIVFTVVAIITAALWSLFSFWGSNAVPVAYVIQEVIPNTGEIQTDCDTPNLTIVENAITGQMRYECGNLGKAREIITFYE